MVLHSARAAVDLTTDRRTVLGAGAAAAILVALCGPARAADPADTVPIYTYHTHPPFLEHSGDGLTHRLARELSHEGNRFRFVVKPVSRPRLNRLIETQRRGIVPWVNPSWFAGLTAPRAIYSHHIAVKDGNVMVSRSTDRLEYAGPSSLDGRIMGGIRGHFYAGVDSYRKRTKRIKRIDGNDHRTNLLRLRNNRIDAMFMPASTAQILLRGPEVAAAVYVSRTPHSRYDRHVMILDDRPEVRALVERCLALLAQDPSWPSSFLATTKPRN